MVRMDERMLLMIQVLQDWFQLYTNFLIPKTLSPLLFSLPSSLLHAPLASCMPHLLEENMSIRNLSSRYAAMTEMLMLHSIAI
jgi:hypothetical protein